MGYNHGTDVVIQYSNQSILISLYMKLYVPNYSLWLTVPYFSRIAHITDLKKNYYYNVVIDHVCNFNKQCYAAGTKLT